MELHVKPVINKKNNQISICFKRKSLTKDIIKKIGSKKVMRIKIKGFY